MTLTYNNSMVCDNLEIKLSAMSNSLAYRTFPPPLLLIQNLEFKAWKLKKQAFKISRDTWLK